MVNIASRLALVDRKNGHEFNVPKCKKVSKKYSNKLSMKALVEKDISMKKQHKEMRKAPHFFYVHLSRELKGTQGNLGSSREALLEVMEGKKLRKRGQRGEISQIRQEQEEEEKRKHRSALRALKNA